MSPSWVSTVIPRKFHIRLVLAFVLLLLIAGLLVLKGWYSSERVLDIAGVKEDLLDVELSLARMLSNDRGFISFNHLDEEFHETGTTKYLFERRAQLRVLHEHIERVSRKLREHDLDPKMLGDVRVSLKQYENAFSDVLSKQLVRGFRDFGLEGIMRRNAHELERTAKVCRQENLLMMRRHEKDFFLRHDEQYIGLLNDLSAKIKAQCLQSSKETGPHEAYLITQYTQTFNRIAEIDLHLGFGSDSGLLSDLNDHQDSIRYQIKAISSAEDVLAEASMMTVRRNDLILLLVGSSLALLLAFQLARSISRPIRLVSEHMRNFSASNTKHFRMEDIKSEYRSSEIQTLLSSFDRMQHQIPAQIEEIERQKRLLEQQNQELTDLNHELDRFAYSVTHDLRSPLTSIMGLIHLAQLEHPEDYEKMYLHHIDDCVQRLDGFIQNLLSYTRNKNLNIELSTVEWSALIESISKKYLIHVHPEVSIRLRTDAATIVTDRFRLEIVLQNLLSNSIRYRNPERPLEIEISTFDSDGQQVIRFCDNGTGIRPEVQERVFDMFFRDAHALHDQGSGLGLFIVRRIVQKLGGTITLTSAPDKGTCFTILLPAPEVSSPSEIDSTEVSVDIEGQEALTSKKKRRALVKQPSLQQP